MENILGSIDNGIKIAKHAYGVISPLLDKYASQHSNSINKSVMNAVKGYDDIKHKVLENHDNSYNDYNHIKHKLLKKHLENYFLNVKITLIIKKIKNIFSCNLYIYGTSR